MKKRIGVLAVTVAASCAVIISGCTGCAGCNGSSRNIAALESNWYANTHFKKIQPTFIDANKEIITYKVTQDIGTALNDNYSVRYSDGEYTTTFYATKFDKTKYAAEEYRDAYPDDLVVYYYKTELSIDTVTFKYGGEERVFKGDSVVTECYFMPVENDLRPLYSSQTIKSVSPAAYKVKNVDEAYVVNDCEYKTYYSYDEKEVKYAKTVIKDGNGEREKPVVNLEKAPNTVFDISSLNVAVRANRISANLSQKVSMYAPAGNLQSYNLLGGELALGEHERPIIESELKENKLFVPEKDGENEKPLETVAIGVQYDGELSGVSQIYWFTKITNPINNVGRATMVKMSVPITYSLGTLNYTLQEIQSTLNR